VKSFRFRLQRVLELRESEVKTEEAALEQLWSRRAQMEAERNALAQSLERMSGAARTQQFLQPSELVMLDRYKEYVTSELQKWAQKLAAQDVRIEMQKVRVVAARGRVKLLEKLRDKSREQWQHEADRELEELAADFSAAQWLRQQG
jgi:flagellar export protein FliJ